MMCNIKKMIASHRLTCDMIGVAMGIGLGFLAANAMVNCCTPGRKMKKKAMNPFKALEDKFCC